METVIASVTNSFQYNNMETIAGCNLFAWGKSF